MFELNFFDLLRFFLRDVLDLPLTDNDEVKILNPELIPESADGKLSRLDIHVNMANRKFNIEMQARKKGFNAERVLYYWCEIYGEKFEYGQLLAAVKKLGIDHVYSPAFARAQSLTQAARLLDENLGKKPVLLTDNHAAKSFLRSHFPELEENFAFYDSKEKCFGDYMHEHHPGAKLISVSNNNSSGAEAAETGCVDYFINARELYRIIMRTGGRPSVKRPIEAEEIAEFEKCGRYAELFEAGGWYVDKPAEELEFTENGKRSNYQLFCCSDFQFILMRFTMLLDFMYPCFIPIPCICNGHSVTVF